MSDISASQTPDPQVLQLAPPVLTAAEVPAKKAERFAVRMWCSFTLATSAAMLGVGLLLTPSPDGAGTHQQLGLPPCGFYHATGIPCPTCGCTTAVSYFAHGHLLLSLLTQPFGFAVALLAAVLLPLAIVGIVTGTWKGPSMYWLSWHWRTWVFGGMGVLILGWIYKIMIVRAHLTF